MALRGKVIVDSTTSHPLQRKAMKLLLLVACSLLILLPCVPGQAAQFSELRLQHMPFEALSGQSVAAGDLDGDGDADLVFGHSGTPIRVYTNEGGVFRMAAWQGSGNTTSARVALADVELDGDLDLIVARSSGIFVMRNSGAAAFTADPAFTTATRCVVDDMDSDGDPDVLAISPATRVWTNDGAGAFTAGQTLPGSSSCAAFGDFDGDGDRDLLLGEDLFLRTGPATFVSSPSAISPPLTFVGSIAVADVDGNGSLDFVSDSFNAFGGENHVYLNDGTARFTDATSQFLAGASGPIYQVVLGDVSGDGQSDLIGYGAIGIVMRLGTTTAFGPEMTTNVYGVTALVDAFGNARPCIAVANPDSTGHRLLALSNGALVDLSGAPGSPVFWPGTFVHRILVSDVSGDGLVDLLATYMYQSHNVWLQGSSGFGAADLVIPVTKPTLLKAAADLDRDGRTDVVASSGIARTPQLYMNRGGTFVDETEPRLGTVTGYRAHTCDLNGDRRVDVAFEIGQGVTMGYYNRLTARPQPSDLPTGATTAELPAVVGIPQLVKHFLNPVAIPIGRVDLFVDLNGDRASDALDVFRRVFLNDGTGQLTLTQTLASSSYSSYATSPVDVDLDGDLDIVTDSGEVWINDGAGLFTDESTARLPGPVSQALVLDVDGDGDRDISALQGSAREWFANDGTGHFQQVPGRASPISYLNATSTAEYDVELDLDGDGDEDFISAGTPVLAIQHNLLRQLDVPLVPGAGAMLDVDVHMNDGGSGPERAAIVFADRTTASPMPLSPFGTWHLSAEALELGVIPVPAHLASAQFPLPVLPGGMLTEIHLQALLMPSADMATWRFSNLVRRPVLQ